MEKSNPNQLLTKAKSLINARRGNDIDLTHALILIDMALKQLSWISVEDELPKKGTQVLSTDGIDYCIDWYDICGLKISEKGQFTNEPNLTWYSDEYGWMQFPVSHWMPLPEPPKEDE